MKFVKVHEAKAGLSTYLATCQREHVVITKHGKLCAVLTGVEGYDMEDLLTAADPSFWRTIRERRRRPGRGWTLEEVRKRLQARRTQPARTRPARRKS